MRLISSYKHNVPIKNFTFLLVCAILFNPWFAFPQNEQKSNKRLGVVREKVNRDTVIPDTTIYSWSHLPGFLTVEKEVDTAQQNVVYHDPSRIDKYYKIGLGNLGQPVMNPDFYSRISVNQTVHWMVEFYEPYLQYHQKVNAFNTKTPFTRLYYTTSERKWQTFHFIHTQNIIRDINIGLRYDIFSSQGLMVFQQSRNRNGSFWIDSNTPRYKAFATANFNRIRNDNNGGVILPSFVTDSTDYDIREIRVKLSQTGNDIRYFDGKIQQQYYLVGRNRKENSVFRFGLAHEMGFNKLQRKYFDPQKTEYFDFFQQQNVDYFANRFNQKRTSDTLSVVTAQQLLGIFGDIGNQNRIMFQTFVKYQKDRYSNFFSDTLFIYQNDTIINSYSGVINSSGNIFSDRVRFSVSLEKNLLNNYRKGNYRAQGHVFFYHNLLWQPTVLRLDFSNYNQTPDYFQQRYYSNHYRWGNRLPNLVGLNLKISETLRRSELEISYRFSRIVNFIYYDKTRIRKVNSQPLEVHGIELSKEQNITPRLSVYPRILFQHSADTIIDIPEIISAATVLFKTPVYFRQTQGRATLQIGLDLWYNTAFYMPDYDPAVNQFFIQRNEKMGGYFIYDMFISAHIKRMVIFARFDNIPSLISGRTHFDAYGYPARPFSTKFGFSWTFYD